MAEHGKRAGSGPSDPPAQEDPTSSCWSCHSKRLPLVCASLIILLGLGAIIGWHTRLPLLFQIHRDFAPMAYNTALCFLACGLSLLMANARRRWLSIGAALGAAALAIPNLLQYLLHVDFGIDQLFFKPYIHTLTPNPGRMALFTSIAFCLAITGLIASGIHRPHRNSSVITAIASAIMIAISALGFIGYAFGLTGAFSWEHIAQISLPTIAAFMALGIGILCIAWRDCHESTGQTPQWLPVTVVVISLTASFLLGSALQRQERAHIERFTAGKLTMIGNALMSELENRHHSMHRMARRWAGTEMPEPIAWEADAIEHLQDDPGYRFIALADENLAIRRAVPPSNTAGIIGRSVLPTGWTRTRLTDHFRTHGGLLETRLDLAGESLSIVSAIQIDGTLKGCIVAALDERKFFESTFPENISGNCHFTITANDRLAHRSGALAEPPDPDLALTREFESHSTRWKIRLWPDHESIQADDSLYSQMVFGLGVILSVVLGISSHLYQLANIKSLEAAERNVMLQTEIAERIRSQKELENASALNNAIVTHSAYSVITTDTRGIITSFNPAAEKMLGYHAGELIGKHTPAIIHDPDEIAARARALSQHLGTEIEAGFEVFVAETKRGFESQHEWSYLRKDGRRIPVTLGVSSLTSSSGEIIGYLGVASDISDLKKAMRELKETHEKLMNASIQIGRAEIATNILHNVGNVLNSVNVSTTLLADKVRNSRISSVTKTSELLAQQNDLEEFFRHDRRGKELPVFLQKLADQLTREQQEILNDLSALDKNIHHIKEIISMQQNYAKASEVREQITVQEIIDLALRMHTGTLNQHQFKIHIDCAPLLIVNVEKHKVLQILVNLISNAKHACLAAGLENPEITIRADSFGNTCRILVRDNGEGIPKENMTRIFNHGFTTKQDGHGFGLHSCAITAKEMHGSLVAESGGPGCGATFTLTFPIS